MTSSYWLTAMLLGYLFGCLQFSYILARTLKKVDIRTIGNGNAGASNTTITLGWKMGVLVGALDILKAIVSLQIIKVMYRDFLNPKQLTFLLLLNGLFVILGHNFPFFMGFKGGKGTASLIGMLVILDYRIALLGILTILLVTLITDYIALGAIALVLMVVGASVFFQYSPGSIGIATTIASMSIYKHLPNLKRIQQGQETGLRSSFKRKS